MPVKMKGTVASQADMQGLGWTNRRFATAACGHVPARLEVATFQADLPLADDPESDFKSCNHFPITAEFVLPDSVFILSE